MKMFEDKEKTKEIGFIDFGEAKPGETKRVTIWLYNDTEAMLTNLKFLIKTKTPLSHEVKIEDKPITIQSEQTEPVTLVWIPSAHMKAALQIPLKVKGDEVYMAERKFTEVVKDD